MSNKPAPRCPGCGAEMELIEVCKHIWRYGCEDCGWRSPAVHGLGKEGKDGAYAKAMKRYAENPWISVKDRLPEHEVDVLVCVTRKHYSDHSKDIRFVAKAFHTDGKTNTENSRYGWSSQYIDMEYDEEADAYIIPEGWWESVEYEDEFSAVDDFVTHWMLLPEAPMEGE